MKTDVLTLERLFTQNIHISDVKKYGMTASQIMNNLDSVVAYATTTSIRGGGARIWIVQGMASGAVLEQFLSSKCCSSLKELREQHFPNLIALGREPFAVYRAPISISVTKKRQDLVVTNKESRTTFKQSGNSSATSFYERTTELRFSEAVFFDATGLLSALQDNFAHAESMNVFCSLKDKLRCLDEACANFLLSFAAKTKDSCDVDSFVEKIDRLLQYLAQ